MVDKKERHQLRWTAKGIECRIDVTMKWYALRTNDRREKTKLAAVCRCIFSKSNDSKSFNAIDDAKPFTNWSIVKAQIITRKLLISSGLVACQMLMLMLADFGHQTIFFPSCFYIKCISCDICHQVYLANVFARLQMSYWLFVFIRSIFSAHHLRYVFKFVAQLELVKCNHKMKRIEQKKCLEQTIE